MSRSLSKSFYGPLYDTAEASRVSNREQTNKNISLGEYIQKVLITRQYVFDALQRKKRNKNTRSRSPCALAAKSYNFSGLAPWAEQVRPINLNKVALSAKIVTLSSPLAAWCKTIAKRTVQFCPGFRSSKIF